ncbi:RnaseH-domain-containing protein, partial [Rhizophagus irregularis]
MLNWTNGPTLVIAYMDDTSYLDSSGDKIQESINIATQFYNFHDVDINGKKSELIVINPKLPREDLYIIIGHDKSKVQATDKEIRYLGCYFSSSNSRKRSIKRIKDIIEKFLNSIRRKCITVGHIAYLINHVLIPRVIYVAQLMTLSENEWNLLFTPVIKLVKQICGLPRSYPTSALYHRYILGINNPWDQICANQITAFTYLINSNSLASRSIMIRCRTAQLRLAIHDNIFEHESESLFLGYQEAKSNLSLHNIIIARKLNIVIQQDYINRTTWAISGGSIPIREIFITHRCLNLLRKIGTSNSYPLIYASQLILPSGHTMSWACYRFIAGLSAKGRIAKWYQLLTQWIKGISIIETSRFSISNFLNNTLQPVSEDKRKHPYVIIKDKNNKLSIGLVKKRTHIKKKGGKIECLIIEVCNIKICSDNPQKAIIQKQECPKIITIAQHNALVLPIFTRLSTGAITHIDWYYMVDSVNRVENITTNIDIQQMEKTPTIEAEIVAIFLALLTAPENSNVTIYTDSLSAINSINSTFDSTTRKWLKKTNNLIIIKIIMLIRKASINIKLVKIKGHSGIIGNDIADKLAKNGQYGNNLFKNNVDFIDNILSYFPVFIDSPIEVNIRRFILKILATYEATEWSLLKNNQEL